MRKIFFWLSALLLLSWGGTQYWPVSVHICGSASEEGFSIRMPLKDKRRLEYFFRDVCFLNAWAYTLLGSKPMSIHQYRKPWATLRYFLFHPEMKSILLECLWPPKFYELCHLLDPEQLKIQLGWDTLNRYISYFPHSRFALYTSDPSDEGIVVLTVIDKVKFIKIVEQHLEDFQHVLQAQTVTPEDLFDNKKLQTFLKDLNTNSLLGTVLGFGRENAQLFHKYRELNLPEWPLVSPWQDEELMHLEKLNQKTISFQPWDLSDLFYPPFVCDPHSEETQQLRQTYREERGKIIQYYEGKDIVEATLSLFNRE